jgi:hypothetical protein
VNGYRYARYRGVPRGTMELQQKRGVGGAGVQFDCSHNILAAKGLHFSVQVRFGLEWTVSFTQYGPNMAVLCAGRWRRRGIPGLLPLACLTSLVYWVMFDRGMVSAQTVSAQG